MEKAIRNRVIDLALRAKFATDRFKDLEKRTSKEVRIKAETKGLCEHLKKGLQKSKKLLADEDATDKSGKDWLAAALPKVAKLEHANAALGPEIVNAETNKAIAALDLNKLPTESFRLRSGHTVVNPDVFRKMLQSEIDAGPKGPRWRIGALLNDLRDLAKLHDKAKA